jgi:hypothetical protein
MYYIKTLFRAHYQKVGTIKKGLTRMTDWICLLAGSITTPVYAASDMMIALCNCKKNFV